MQSGRTRLAAAVFAAFSALPSGPLRAHAADQGFVLLLPTTAYTIAGTLAVVATILLLAVLREGQLRHLFSPRGLALGAAPRALVHSAQLLASLALAGLIWIGLYGPTDPQANLLPLVLWTLWWMLLFVLQGLVFDIWSWINPWPALHRLLLGDAPALLPLSRRLSIWPAVALMAAFQGFVLADTAPNDPGRLAMIAAGYWVFTLAGMTVFGRDPWLRQVECFSVLFALIGRMRLVLARAGTQIGLPGWQMFTAPAFDLSHAAFALVLLASGSFDGLYETFWWLDQLGINPLEYPGRSALVTSTLLGLYGGTVLLAAVFAGAVLLGRALLRDSAVPFRAAFTSFAITLLPIAIGYHFAHYFVTFLVQIQVVLASLGDPMAMGWNLLGLAERPVKVGFLTQPGPVRLIWLTQAGIVVLSHVTAVLLSHRTAEILCNSRRDTVALQAGLSILMILYTVFGLWLLASPRGA